MSHKSPARLLDVVLPAGLAAVAAAALVLWVGVEPGRPIEQRVSGMDQVPAAPPDPEALAPQPGEPVRGPGQPSNLAGSWPWFRGAEHDAIAHDSPPLARTWPAVGPRRVWEIELGQGYAAAAVAAGRVYVLDHVRDRAADVLRCLSLDDGREIWSNSYRVLVPPNHGMSRTVPAVKDDCVISLGPMCDVVCWDAETGRTRWVIDLVLDYGATVPPWYAGQCPLIDQATDRLILAPGGTALLLAVDYHMGEVIWESPNPRGWAMTHSSIIPMELAGRRMYVYCAKQGVVGVDALDGTILWETTDWRISMATCPSPVPLGDGRVFFCGGYNAGALILRVVPEAGGFRAETLRRFAPREFSSEQQTPVLYEGHLYGVRQSDKRMVCLDLEGNEIWNSGRDKFGAGPYMIADNVLLVMDDRGTLSMAEATPAAWRPLARAQVIEDGVDSWGPMALVAGRLIVRDFTRMVCLDLREPQ